MEGLKNDIYIISTGTGHPDMLTHQALIAMENIDVALGSERFKSWVDVPFFEPYPLVKGTIDFIKQHGEHTIGVFVTGDAGFYSLAKTIVNEFGKRRVKIIPGVSVVQAAFAAIAEPWEDASFFSAHGRENIDINEILACNKFLLLCDKNNNPKKIISENSRLLQYFEIYVASNVSLPGENIQKIDLSEPISSDPLSCIIGIRKGR